VLLMCWLLLGAGLASATTPLTPPMGNGTAATAITDAAQTAPLARRPRVGLVLSGGGARGFAHVGVLRALEAARVPVDVVVGTSMGAIVGGLYASGMSPQVLEQELMSIDWPGLFEGGTPRQNLSQRQKEESFEMSPVLQLGFRNGEFRLPSGALSSRSLEWLLRRYTLPSRHLSSFDALPIPFRAVATDMETGDAVVMSQGDLAAALRASMSVPGVFSPLEVDGRILGDGGLVDNLPVDVARQLGAEVVIAVNIGTPLAGRDTLGSVLGVSAQMISILTEQNVQRSVASLTRHDLLLAPPLGKTTAGDFSKAPAIARMGHDYAQTVMSSLERFSVSEAEYAAWNLQRQPLAEPLPSALAFVRVDGVDADRAAHLTRQMNTAPGQPLNPHLLEADLSQISANTDYGRVDYQLAPDRNTLAEGVVVKLEENPLGNNFFRVGLDLRTDFQGDSGFNLRINHNRHWLTPNGTEWRNQISIGDTTGVRTEIYHPWGGDRDRFVSAYASVHQTKVELYSSDGVAQALLGRRTSRAGIDHGWTAGRGGQAGEMRLGLFTARRSIAPDLVKDAAQTLYSQQHWVEGGLNASLVTDQLDHANFPQQGYRAKGLMQLGRRQADGVNSSFAKLDLEGTQVMSSGPHTFNLHARLARVTNVPAAAVDEYALGGFQQLSGYKVGQLAGNYLGLLRLGYYRRLDLSPGVARAWFAGGTMEAGNAWKTSQEFQRGQLRTGYSLYLGADTGLGPIYLSLVHAPRMSTGIYLFVGRP
jgi:NTE family protein